MPFTLRSPDFINKGEIPTIFTCQGDNISPALTWTRCPPNTKSLVLIVDDPDAPKGVWVHWILYNIPPTATKLPSTIHATNLPYGTLLGRNSWKEPKYRGPCPPIGQHRYLFKLYALDIELPDLDKPTKAVLKKEMEDHIIAKADLIGTYKKF